jgi:hypothetical protein
MRPTAIAGPAAWTKAGLHAGLSVGIGLLVGCMPAPATSNTPEAGASMPSSIVDPYLEIQTALYAGSLDALKANAGTIATAAAPLGAPAFKIGTAAVQLSATTDLADARATFGTLSDAIITYMDGLSLTTPEGVEVAECNQTGRRWLQEGSSIANPYDGSSTCGNLR